MRTVDGYLSKLLQKVWADAVVYRDTPLEPIERDQVLKWIRRANAWMHEHSEGKAPDDDVNTIVYEGIVLARDLDGALNLPKPKTVYMVERIYDDEIADSICLGVTFKEAKSAIEALRRQKEEEDHGQEDSPDPLRGG